MVDRPGGYPEFHVFGPSRRARGRGQHRLDELNRAEQRGGGPHHGVARVEALEYDSAVSRLEAPSLALPAIWLPASQRLEAVSDAERLLVLPLQPVGTLVVRHFAEFSVVKNLQSTLHDNGAFLWFLVLMVSIPGSVLGVGLTQRLAPHDHGIRCLGAGRLHLSNR